MRTWNQAAIHFRQGDKIKQCPLCNVPATPKHIVWLCTWHHNQGHAPLAIEWTERLQDPLKEPLWAHGWVPKEPQDHLQVAQPLQGHGCWSTLEPLTLQPWQGLSVGCHTLLLRPEIPGLDLRTLRAHLLIGHTLEEGHHHGHGTRSTDQSSCTLPRAHHPGPVCGHTDQRDRPVGLSLGGMDQPKKAEGI